MVKISRRLFNLKSDADFDHHENSQAVPETSIKQSLNEMGVRLRERYRDEELFTRSLVALGLGTLVVSQAIDTVTTAEGATDLGTGFSLGVVATGALLHVAERVTS